MCCSGKMCRLCTCLILVIILIGLLFGFGIFAHGFQKIKQCVHGNCSGKMQMYPPPPASQGPIFRMPGAPAYYP